MVLLLKLALKSFKLEDLEKFFETFGMKSLLDIDILKGFFAFYLPISEDLEDKTQI